MLFINRSQYILFIFIFLFYFLQIFHTIAIILLIVSTCILLIGVTLRMINNHYNFNRQVPFIVTMFVSSVSVINVNETKKKLNGGHQILYLFLSLSIQFQTVNILNGLLYYTSIKLVRTTCENY